MAVYCTPMIACSLADSGDGRRRYDDAVAWLGMICERALELRSQLMIYVCGIYHSLDALTQTGSPS